MKRLQEFEMKNRYPIHIVDLTLEHVIVVCAVVR